MEKNNITEITVFAVSDIYTEMQQEVKAPILAKKSHFLEQRLVVQNLFYLQIS